MNKIYKIIWNKLRACWVVVSESVASASGKSQTSTLCSSGIFTKICIDDERFRGMRSEISKGVNVLFAAFFATLLVSASESVWASGGAGVIVTCGSGSGTYILGTGVNTGACNSAVGLAGFSGMANTDFATGMNSVDGSSTASAFVLDNTLSSVFFVQAGQVILPLSKALML